MSGAAWARLGARRQRDDYSRPWMPPPGWRETSDGIFVPPDYRPLDWELHPPAAKTRDERRAEYVKCQRSLAYFAFHYCWSVDVDTNPEEPIYRRIPALPHLRRFFHAWQRPENIHVEKTRQMMLSWACMATFLWDINFHDNWQDLAVSKKAIDVDDGGDISTYNSLLGKVRMMYEHLPEYLYMPFEIVKFRIRNPTRNSGIRGETGNRDAGRSGTYKRAVLDEAARIPASEMSFKAARQACKRGLGLISTPEGKGNVFARIRFTPATTFKKESYWWPENPLKNEGLACAHCTWHARPGDTLSPLEQYRAHVCPHPEGPKATSPWYRREGLDLRPDQIGSELDISYETSVRGRVFPTFNGPRHIKPMETYRARTQLGVEKWEAEVGPRGEHEHLDAYRRRYLRAAMDPNLPIFTAWDFGVGDPTAILLGQEVSSDGPLIRWIDEYENTDQSFDHYHAFWRDLWLSVWKEIGGDSVHPFLHYGDPAGKNRESDLRSWIMNLGSASPPIHIIHAMRTGAEGGRKRIGTMAEWLDFIREQYRQDHVEISSWCAGLIDATTQYHYPVDEEGNPIPGATEPVHDQWSHKCSAKRYMYQYRYAHLLRDRVHGGQQAAEVLARGATRARELTPEF